MPGIVGLITRMPREYAEAELHRMVEPMLHEDFYVTGTWVEESLGVYAGWVARKGSFADGMPLRNERGNLMLLFSGEEYPEPGITEHLKRQGHELSGDGPSYLVHLAEEDSAFPGGLNGWFHGLLTDRSKGAATLFNDRYGMHRLYYHEAKEAFYFAAEAKAILAVRPESRRIDPQGLGDFVSCGCTLEGGTLFEGIRVLPQAARWVFRNGSLEQKGTYFEPREWESQEPLSLEAYYWEIRDVLSRNLPRYFAGPERIAMSLTGGLDTRMVLAWHKLEPGSLPCYTFGSMFRDTQDVVVGRQVASICGQPFHVIRVGEECLSQFARYAQRAVYLSDGCLDVGRAPDLYVDERARQMAPVRMTGNCGGEVLRRVRAFKAEAPIAGVFRPEVLPYAQKTTETYARLLRKHPTTFSVFEQSAWHHAVLALDQTQFALRTPYMDNELVRTVFRAPEPAFANEDLCLRLIADGNAALRALRTDRGAGVNGWLSGVGSRVVLEFLFKAEYAFDMGMPQWFAPIDRILAPLHLERLLLGRHKPYHFRLWYRRELADYVRQVLLDPRSRSRPYVEAKALETAVVGHLKGTQNHTSEIHKLLTLELVHRVFLENSGSSKKKD